MRQETMELEFKHVFLLLILTSAHPVMARDTSLVQGSHPHSLFPT